MQSNLVGFMTEVLQSTERIETVCKEVKRNIEKISLNRKPTLNSTISHKVKEAVQTVCESGTKVKKLA